MTATAEFVRETQSSANTEIIAFEIDGETYGVEITDVREIRAWSGATPLPHTAHFVRGVMNLRGAVVPIIDLRARFGRERTDATPIHVVIVVAIDERWVGMLVDAVSDIVALDVATIQAPPDAMAHSAQGLLRGVSPVDDQMIALIDLPRVLNGAVPEAA